MSTGKRIAKRSIIGTRVGAPGEDGKYYSGVIQAVKTPASIENNSNCINLTPNTRYTVRFDSRQGTLGRTTAEFFESDLIGPGFKSVLGTELVPHQKCFVTFNGREVCGEVMKHHLETDEVIIRIHPSGTEGEPNKVTTNNDLYISQADELLEPKEMLVTVPKVLQSLSNKIGVHQEILDDPFEVQKRLEEVRLLESRKSARLADQDTDFARLADMAGDRKRTASHTIDVPAPSYHGSRKRRPSNSQDDSLHPPPQTDMDECNAALVLMSLSCSPQNAFPLFGTSPGSSSSSSASFRSTPSPPPSNSPINSFSSASDEGIVMDYMLEDQPRKKKNLTRVVFQCTFRGCPKSSNTCEDIESHVRVEHNVSPKEEEFYYTEFELGLTSPPPTLSHRDMARPPHEDPDYQRQLVGSMRQSLLSGPMTIIPQSPHKYLKLSPQRPHSPKMPISPRRVRGENRKCRKMYGMDHKEQWCTQCKWKKACSRFGD